MAASEVDLPVPVAHEHDQAALDHGQFLDDRRQVELVHPRDPRLDAPDHQAAVAPLHKGAGPEAAVLLGLQGVVALVGAQEIGLLGIGQGAEHEVAHFLLFEGGRVEGVDLPVHLDGRRGPGRQEAVGAVPFNDLAHELFNVHGL